MPTRLYDERELPVGEQPADQASAPPPAAAQLLALQSSAGNAAVGGLLQRKFYEQTVDGTWIYHKEDPGPEFEDTGKTTSWGYFWSYPVYRRVPSGQQQGTATEAPPRNKRRRAKKRKPKTAPPEVTQAPEEELSEQEEDEDPPSILAPSQQVLVEDDDDGFIDVKSRSQEKREAAANADIPALVRQVDDHEGAPLGVLETFNRLFNALHAQNQLQLGQIRSAYVSKRWDKPRGGFSVAVTIPPLQNWILHAHLEANGEPATGENATHYKRGADEFALGASIALLPKQIAALVPDAASCLHYARNTAHLRI